MANLRDIRNRIESVQNTQQITRAMKMVAAAKLRKAQDRIIQTRPYSKKMKQVVARLAANAEEENVLLRQPESTNRVLFVVIGSDRGLCGGFNNNLFKVLAQKIEEEFAQFQADDKLDILAIGKKAAKHFGKRNYNVVKSFPGFFDDLHFNQAAELMKDIISQFKSGTYDAIYLVYNEFKSVIAQNRMIEAVLPINPASIVDDDQEVDENLDYIFEPDVDSILDKLLPLHLNMQLWKAILESNAAEQGARMTAMDNATENAKELQSDLKLEYNQARQSAITTEIAEIVSGAQALSEN